MAGQHQFIDLSGMNFGRLTVVSRAANNRSGSARWVVSCSCSGKQKTVSANNLRSGKTRSCGCLRGTKPPRTHCHQGHQLTPDNAFTKKDGRRRCRLCSNHTSAKLQRQWRKHKPDAYRHKELKKKYGVGLDEKEEMLRRQGGRCAACGTDTPKGRHKAWCLDRCHTTGRVRGVLCSPCNIALGLVNDDVEKLQGLIDYLKQAA